MLKIRFIFLFSILPFISNGQTLFIKDKINTIVEQIGINDKIYIEFYDTIALADNGKIIIVPLLIKTTASIDSLSNSRILLHNPWMNAYTETGENIINISVYSDMETDYNIMGISNKINLMNIHLIQLKKKTYNKSDYNFSLNNKK